MIAVTCCQPRLFVLFNYYPRRLLDNRRVNAKLSQFAGRSEPFLFTPFLPGVSQLIPYVAFRCHVVDVFGSLLWGKGSNFRRLKQDSEDLSLQSCRPALIVEVVIASLS